MPQKSSASRPAYQFSKLGPHKRADTRDNRAQPPRESQKKRVIPPQQPPTSTCRVGNWNVCGASPSKMPLIYQSLERRSVDICVLTETKWTFATGDWLTQDSAWEAHRVDFLGGYFSSRALNTLKRGGVSLLVNKNLEAQVYLIDKMEGPLNIA